MMHDAKTRSFLDTWTLTERELLAWSLVVLVLPAGMLLWRSAALRRAQDAVAVRIERPADSAPGARDPSPARLDLNRASAAELEVLPGIGPAKAKRMVEYRAAHGPFARVEDLAKVRGISPATLDEIAPLLEVGGGP